MSKFTYHTACGFSVKKKFNDATLVLGTIAVGRRQYCVNQGNGSGDGEKTDLRNIQDVKSIHSADFYIGGKERAMEIYVGNSGRDPTQGDNSEFIDVDLQVPLRHPIKDIGTLVGNIFLEFRNFRMI